MIRRCFAFVVIAGACWPATGWAQSPAEATPPPVPPAAEAGSADALFDEAKNLRDAGNYAAACPKFAESRALANGVGVTLYLADCYQKLGRTQSAWTEFHNAEKLAREKGDKRADVAAARAQELEPSLNRVTLALPPLAAGQAAPEVTVDGVAVPPAQLNAPLVMDPGEHALNIVTRGGSARALTINVDPNVPSLVVPLAEPEPAAPASGESAAPAAAFAPVSPSDSGATRRWVGFGLIAAGAGAAGIATWLLTSKVTGMTASGSPCDSELRSNAQPAAAVLYSAGGIAVISGIVLAVTASHHAAEVSLAPVALPGGGGAVIGGAF